MPTIDIFIVKYGLTHWEKLSRRLVIMLKSLQLEIDKTQNIIEFDVQNGHFSL